MQKELLIFLQDNKIRLKGDTFDNDAVIMKNIKSNKVILQNYKTNQRILEFDFSGFPYLALCQKRKHHLSALNLWQNTADRTDGTQIYKQKKILLNCYGDKIFECKYSIKFYKD